MGTERRFSNRDGDLTVDEVFIAIVPAMQEVASSKPSTERLAESIERTFLGVTLALLVIVSAGTASGSLRDGNLLLALPLVLLALGAALAVVYLFVDGVREG